VPLIPVAFDFGKRSVRRSLIPSGIMKKRLAHSSRTFEFRRWVPEKGFKG
jgi:hypothetical protein